MKFPYTPFSTRLSGSAKETELRLRNIFQWKKKRPPVVALILAALVALSCGGLVSCQPKQAGMASDSGSVPLANTQETLPLIKPAVEPTEPEVIASISLADAEVYPYSINNMELDTVSVDTMGEILCDKTLTDGTRVVCYWEPGSEYTKYWAIRQGDSLLRFIQEDSAYTEGYDVDTFTNVLGYDGFRILAPRGAAYFAYDYYILDANGVPQLLACCANLVLETDADGDGEVELVYFYHDGRDIIYYFRRDDQVFQVAVTDILLGRHDIQAWTQEAESWTDNDFPVNWRPYDPNRSPTEEVVFRKGFLCFTPETIKLCASETATPGEGSGQE